MSKAVLFPGQGAQTPGMGKDWCQAFPTAQKTFDEASEALGFSLSEACWAEDDTVHRTDIAQSGILTTSVAVLRVAMEQGFDRSQVQLTAGLSLGEYTALWFAHVIDFQDAVRLVRLRGEAMQAASDATPSSMVSLMGAKLDQAQALTQSASEAGICQVANLNAPGQIIASGELAALDLLEERAKEHGIRRTRRLTVAGGFHSECMRPAADRLAAALKEVELREPDLPFVTNVTGETVADPAKIQGYLADQVCASVLWEKSMRTAIERGITQFVEPAPGRVLGALLGKIHKGEPELQVTHWAEPGDMA